MTEGERAYRLQRNGRAMVERHVVASAALQSGAPVGAMTYDWEFYWMSDLIDPAAPLTAQEVGLPFGVCRFGVCADTGHAYGYALDPKRKAVRCLVLDV